MEQSNQHRNCHFNHQHHHHHHIVIHPNSSHQHHHHVIMTPHHYYSPLPNSIPTQTLISQASDGGSGGDDHELVNVEDEEPIFVLSDEWREFFAKSEAKRREAKKLAKTQAKN